MESIKSSFLRSCINQSTLDVQFAKKILHQLCDVNKVAEPDLKLLIENINKEISQYGQTLSVSKFPLTGQEYLIFGINQEFSYPKLGHPLHTEDDQRYFTALLNKLATREDYSMQWHEAFSFQDPEIRAKPIAKKRMEELLELWKQQGYFYEKDDLICYGPRMLIEFGFHLKKTHPDQIEECLLCKKLLFWGIKCLDCRVPYHSDCIRKYLRTRSNCLSCKRKWTTPLNEKNKNE